MTSAAIGLQVRTRSDIPKVLRKVRRANIESLGHAGATIRLTAKRSIRKSPNPAEPGRPPKTRRGQLRSSIRFAVEKNKQRVVMLSASRRGHTSSVVATGVSVIRSGRSWDRR